MCKMIQLNEEQYVAEIKLPHIQNIMEQAKKAKHINRIMLFGSSIEERCTNKSDIDIAVFGDKDKCRYLDSKEFGDFKDALFRFDWNQDYDVLYFKENANNKSNIMTDINNGVEIYRRSVDADQ